MNLPIPEISEFVGGFATCGGIMAGAVALKAAWPKIKAAFVAVEDTAYAEYKAAVDAAHSKIDALSNAAANAVNAIRGDVETIRKAIDEGRVRLTALETAVGIKPPAPAGSIAPAAPPSLVV